MMVLYHMNMGYPLLDEDSVVTIPSTKVEPKDEAAAAGLENWMKMEKSYTRMGKRNTIFLENGNMIPKPCSKKAPERYNMSLTDLH